MEAEHFQPVRVGLAGQQFGGALVNALGMFAAQKAVMVEEELEEFQVSRAQLATQEKIVAQSAVEVLDDRAGADDLFAQGAYGLLQRVEAVTQSCTQRYLFLPAERLAFVQSLQVEQFADEG